MAIPLKMKKWQAVTVAVLVLATVTSIAYAAKLRSQLSELREHPELQAEAEAASIVVKVGLLIDLPTDETPSIATVSDPEQLKDQPFFAKAREGDKVLIYANAKKAILYNPTENKVMDITQLTLEDTTTPTEDVAAAEDAAEGSTDWPYADEEGEVAE